MIIRYDFGEKLDLSKFQKQALRHIASMRQLTYHFFVKDYKLVADISTPDDRTSHEVRLTLFSIHRDNDGEIKSGYAVVPGNDLRFKELSSFNDLFPIDQHEAIFESNNVDKTVKELSDIIKIVHKINSLKAFL